MLISSPWNLYHQRKNPSEIFITKLIDIGQNLILLKAARA